jgi:hypothetical protein
LEPFEIWKINKTDFSLGTRSDVFWLDAPSPSMHWMPVFARLRPSVSFAQAQAGLIYNLTT